MIPNKINERLAFKKRLKNVLVVSFAVALIVMAIMVMIGSFGIYEASVLFVMFLVVLLFGYWVWHHFSFLSDEDFKKEVSGTTDVLGTAYSITSTNQQSEAPRKFSRRTEMFITILALAFIFQLLSQFVSSYPQYELESYIVFVVLAISYFIFRFYFRHKKDYSK